MQLRFKMRLAVRRRKTAAELDRLIGITAGSIHPEVPVGEFIRRIAGVGESPAPADELVEFVRMVCRSTGIDSLIMACAVPLPEVLDADDHFKSSAAIFIGFILYRLDNLVNTAQSTRVLCVGERRCIKFSGVFRCHVHRLVLLFLTLECAVEGDHPPKKLIHWARTIGSRGPSLRSCNEVITANRTFEAGVQLPVLELHLGFIVGQLVSFSMALKAVQRFLAKRVTSQPCLVNQVTVFEELDDHLKCCEVWIMEATGLPLRPVLCLEQPIIPSSMIEQQVGGFVAVGYLIGALEQMTNIAFALSKIVAYMTDTGGSFFTFRDVMENLIGNTFPACLERMQIYT